MKMDSPSYSTSASKSSVVSSSGDGNESEIDGHPNPPKKHCSSSFQVRILYQEIQQKVGRNFSLVRV